MMSFMDPRAYGAIIRDLATSRLPGSGPRLRSVKSMPNTRASSFSSNDTASTDSISSATNVDSASTFPAHTTALAPYDPALVLSQNRGSDPVAAGVSYEIMRTAQSQSNNPSHDPRVARAMRIDAVKYGLLALPRDLSPPEIAVLHDSLPEALRYPVGEPADGTRTNQSLLRGTMSSVTRLLLTCIVAILPVLMMMGTKVVQLERRLEVRQHLSAVIVLVVTYSGMERISADTPAVRQLTAAAYWVFDGVVGGVLDGAAQVQSQEGSAG